MPLLDSSSHAVNNSHAYSPLPDDSHIRLVEILPGVVTDPVGCRLLTGRRDTSQFEALSYTWGSSSLGASIILNDAYFMITNNLHLALRYLRYPSASRVMWIDAICINQLDNEERGHQVQHMRSIYQNSTRVVI
ncbi:heterokaryon incompatibility protein-domain-containing protein, partial [Bisporella sp. PMI_857]